MGISGQHSPFHFIIWCIMVLFVVKKGRAIRVNVEMVLCDWKSNKMEGKKFKIAAYLGIALVHVNAKRGVHFVVFVIKLRAKVLQADHFDSQDFVRIHSFERVLRFQVRACDCAQRDDQQN